MFIRLLRNRTPWLWAAQFLFWGSLAALLGLLASIHLVDLPSLLRSRNLDNLGMTAYLFHLANFSFELSFGLVFGVHLLILVGSIGSAIFLVTRRPNNIFIVYVGMVLLWMGINFSEAMFWAATPQKMQAFGLVFAIGLLAAYPLLYLLPDGRLIFRWARPAIIAYTLLRLLAPDFGVLETQYFILASILEDLLWLTALFALFQRYRKHSTPEEKQQIKWVLYGLALLIVPRLFYLLWQIFFFNTYSIREHSQLEVLLTAGGALLTSLLFLAVPVSFLIATLKHRLWDINYVINRSLAYGTLTILLGGLFLGSFLLLRLLLRSVFIIEQDLLAAAAPAALAAMLFNPTRLRLKRWVDRTFYGIQLDYEGSLKAYQRQEKAVQQAAGPDTFGSYTLLNLLGRGGMGEIYQARSASGRLAAIKILPAAVTGEEFRQRFQREALTIQSLEHPNIVRLYESGEKHGAPYMIMEYIAGENLSASLGKCGRFSLAESLPVLRDVAAALDYAHARGVIHRDIKPSNIMLAAGGSRAVLMDFGIAHLSDATRLTRTDGFVGTLDYVAPEQIQGAAGVDHRADIYSLGVLAFQMLSGRLPFQHNSPGAMIMAHLLEPAPSLAQIQPDLPPAAAAAVQRALAKTPGERFDSAGEFVAALGE